LCLDGERRGEEAQDEDERDLNRMRNLYAGPPSESRSGRGLVGGVTCVAPIRRPTRAERGRGRRVLTAAQRFGDARWRKGELDSRSRKALLVALSTLLHDCVVLLVEDDPLVAEATRLLLEDRGARVCVVPDGAVALHELGRAIPDLIISDLTMPQLDGYGLIREMRTRMNTRAIPVLAASGLTDDADRERLRAAGFDASGLAHHGHRPPTDDPSPG
jgi:CheY-like chemotaxis protein